MSELLVVVLLWLHAVATLVWLGGIVILLLVLLPAARQVLGADAGKLLGEVSRRFTPLANGAIVLLLLSGAALMVLGNGDSNGGRMWSMGPAMLFKLLLFLLMAAVHFYRGLVLAPQVANSAAGEEKVRLQQWSLRLVKVNFAVGLTVLLLSAIV
ncbi:MAG: hypothetical protein A2091_01645 [Desulfuromonadales bacterium GWD2_61_12]|nr:MAG: hypothetical protein A2091_01645 [Desulfuromonadales bacterium GWD2_61_12]HAD03604.1 hypothetical protein [Desulfuromonas sp.]HBT81920.1 hypothetical protein [Desulfuromonas sp.]